MPAPTIRSRIWLDVLETLAGVSTAAGASADPQAVEEPNPGAGNSSGNYKFTLHTDDPPAEDESPPYGFRLWNQPFRVTFSVYLSKDVVGADLREMAESAAADVESALTEDGSYQRGGLAIDTTATGSAVGLDSDDTHKADVVCNFSVMYRHAYADPTAQS